MPCGVAVHDGRQSCRCCFMSLHESNICNLETHRRQSVSSLQTVSNKVSVSNSTLLLWYFWKENLLHGALLPPSHVPPLSQSGVPKFSDCPDGCSLTHQGAFTVFFSACFQAWCGVINTERYVQNSTRNTHASTKDAWLAATGVSLLPTIFAFFMVSSPSARGGIVTSCKCEAKNCKRVFSALP